MAGAAGATAERLVAGRPRHFPGPLAWVLVGVSRNPRGVVGALLATWFYLPFALLTAAFCAVVLGVAGFFGGLFLSDDQLPSIIVDLPVLGPALDVILPRTSGVLGGLVGILTGLVLGFVGSLLLFWVVAFAEDPLTGAGSVLGVVVFGLLAGLVYTLYRVGCERLLLRAGGVRRLSRREQELILPIVRECTRRLRLANHPPVLIDDTDEPYAAAHTRHIVISRGLLARLDYDPEVIAGVVCHGLVHWRNGDAISATFIRGVALPLYLVHAAAGWLTRVVRHPLVPALVWLLLWPVMLTVRLVVMPAQAADSRRAELRADQGAVLAGHREGLRRVIERFGNLFEAGRNGWSRAVCANHPADELRLERLEEPGGHYPLPTSGRAGRVGDAGSGPGDGSGGGAVGGSAASTDRADSAAGASAGTGPAGSGARVPE